MHSEACKQGLDYLQNNLGVLDSQKIIRLIKKKILKFQWKEKEKMSIIERIHCYYHYIVVFHSINFEFQILKFTRKK